MAKERSAGRGELVFSNEGIVVVLEELESFRSFEEEELSADGFLHPGHGRDGEDYDVPCPPEDGIPFPGHCLLLPLSPFVLLLREKRKASKLYRHKGRL